MVIALLQNVVAAQFLPEKGPDILRVYGELIPVSNGHYLFPFTE
jgi:hypothetical protein